MRTMRTPVPRHRAELRVLIVVLVVMLLLFACGGDGGGEAAPDQPRSTAQEATSTAPAGTVEDEGKDEGEVSEVQLQGVDLRFEPEQLEARAGRVRIVFENRDAGIPHNVRVEGPGEPASEVEQGIVTQRLEFSMGAGTYTYVCDVHPDMRGELVLTE
jgi:plastocyanin